MPEILEFGRLSDFVRSTAVKKINEYFESPFVRSVLTEIPNIEKYEISDQPEDDRFVSSIHVQRYFANLFEKLPLIAITTVGERQFPTNIGRPYFAEKRLGNIVGTLVPPFSLVEGDTLDILIDGRFYSILFKSPMFIDMNNITLAELSELFLQIMPGILIFDVDGFLGLADMYGRKVIIDSGSAVTKLGLAVGQGSPSTKKASMTTAENMTLQIDIVTADRNQRTEITDVIGTLFEFYLFDKDLGQWVFPKNSILFESAVSKGNESQAVLETAPISKIFLNTISIPLIAFASVDRDSDVEDLTILGAGTIP